VARRLTLLKAVAGTARGFEPEVWQQSAGRDVYYDNMNWVFLCVYRSETLGSKALCLMRVENGGKSELLEARALLPEGQTVYLKSGIVDRSIQFFYSLEKPGSFLGLSFRETVPPLWCEIGSAWDTTKFSDEYCKHGEFTGTFVGVTCTDATRRTAHADFDWFEHRDLQHPDPTVVRILSYSDRHDRFAQATGFHDDANRVAGFRRFRCAHPERG
jgi:xylan 1,4-beta-xylosidase